MIQVVGDDPDIWVYYKKGSEIRYLLLHTSQEKADKWFGGGRFWQIPGEYGQENESPIDVIQKALKKLGLNPKAIWAVEHCYTIFNRRFNNIRIIPVFAAEVDWNENQRVNLTWEHAEFKWMTAEECKQVLNFRGLLEGLEWTRHYITENPTPAQEFKMF
jgi:NUDIX domain